MTNFFYYDLIFLIVFSLAVIIFLYKRKKNLKREGLMYLYRTKVGMKIIDYIGGKYKKTLKFLSYVVIICGYALMAAMIYLLWQLVYVYIKSPDIIRAIKVPPLMPLIPYLPSMFKIDFLPPFYFTYWIISIAIIAVFHEFSHGIFMKFNNIRIKSTGFGFLGPFLAAFVEQDDKQMIKKSKFAQISVLSAGTFANLILAILFFLILAGFFAVAYVPSGAMFNTYMVSPVSIASIKNIDGISINSSSSEEILNIISEKNLTNELILGGDGNKLELMKINADNQQYLITLDDLEKQLKINNESIFLFDDLPAVRNELKGTIISVDNQEVKTYEDLAFVMDDYKIGDKINIKTRFENTILDYNLVLGKDPNQKNRAILGIGVLETKTRLIGKISDFFNFFKKPATEYQPKFNSDLIIFIYNLIWWIALVNISVALANMLPMGIFDGGRMFMLTILRITGSKKFAEITFKIVTWIILGIFLLLMFFWAVAIF